VRLWACPHCGGAVEDVEPLIQYLEELPVLRAHVTKLRTYQGHCARCGKTVRSTHPRQMSVAAGAAAVQLGARAVAAAAQLKDEIGLTLRKSCRVLELLCGLRTTAGGLAQAFQRAGQKLQADYEQLGREMAAYPVVHTGNELVGCRVSKLVGLCQGGHVGGKQKTVFEDTAEIRRGVRT
jgi:transposase